MDLTELQEGAEFKAACHPRSGSGGPHAESPGWIQTPVDSASSLGISLVKIVWGLRSEAWVPVLAYS